MQPLASGPWILPGRQCPHVSLYSDAEASQLRRLLRAVPWSKTSGTFHSFHKHVTCTPVCQGLCWLLGNDDMMTSWLYLGPCGSRAERFRGDTGTQGPGTDFVHWLLNLHPCMTQNGWGREAPICPQLSLYPWVRGHVS